MKKELLFSVTLLMMSVNVLADELTATLQQGENIQAFFGVDAFKQAYEAARNTGAIITLSQGTFNPVESIEKTMTIMGYGAFNGDGYRTNVANMNIMADNVHIEGIYFSENVVLGNVSNCHIKRCYLNNKLTANGTHINTFIDQCVVKYDYAIETGVNYIIKNTTLNSFQSMNTIDNKAQITNCVIWYWISSASGKQPYAIYMDNVLGTTVGSYTCDEASEFYYNFFIYVSSSTFTPQISYPVNCKNQGNSSYTGACSGWVKYPAGNITSTSGMDGTPIGIVGGSGFSSESSIPRITSSTIGSSTDSQGKINVNISATVGPN